jgi:hypothetical protein
MPRLQVFISSAFWTLQYEREFLALTCERMGWDALEFPEDAIAGSPGKEYLRRLREADVLVYLVGTQRSAATDRELELAQEIGIPIVPFARWNQTRGGRRQPKAAKEFIARTGAEFMQCFDSLRELEQGLIDGVSAVIAERVARANVSLEPYSERLYVDARELLELSERRYGVAQQTSTLLLGPNKSRRGPEDVWLAEWKAAIANALNGDTKLELLHIFHGKATMDQLQGKRRSDFPDAAKSIAYVKSILPLLSAGAQVRVVMRERPVAPALLADGGLLIPATYEVSHYFRVRHALSAANQLWTVFDRIADEHDDALTRLADFLDAAEAVL